MPQTSPMDCVLPAGLGPMCAAYGAQGWNWRTCCKQQAHADDPWHMLQAVPTLKQPCRLDPAQGQPAKNLYAPHLACGDVCI